MKFRVAFNLSVIVLGIFYSTTQGDLTWPGCADLQPSDFRMVRLVGKSTTNNPRLVDATLTEPIKLALDMDASGNVDVYWVERLGGVKRYSPVTNTVTKLAQLSPTTASNEGLVGIALDPGFKTNRWMYLYYSFAAEYRVSRFTLNGNSLDMGSEIIMLRIPIDVGRLHTGGAMTFDGYGDLWITVGDNAAGERGAANTNDLRGSILRIHPTPQGTYTIPAGNWRETLAGDYSAADLNKIKPEIYVKGTRNAYSIAVDPVRRWLAWGDVGPDWYTSSDQAHPTEEHDLVTKPGFMGWPYFAGNNICNGTCTKDPAGPSANFSGNTGVTQLPPVVRPINYYPRASAITGPIYRYDGDLASNIKMPPHFNRKWMMSDFRSIFIMTTLSDDATQILDRDTVFQNLSWYGAANQNTLLDLQQGPDGAIYVVNYNGWYTTDPTTSLARFEYLGSCLPAEPKLEVIPGTGISSDIARQLPGVKIEGQLVRISNPGAHQIRLVDINGKQLFSHSGLGETEYTLPQVEATGIRILKITTEDGSLSKIILSQ